MMQINKEITKLVNKEVESSFEKIENQDCIKISNFNTMKSFFMNIVSNSNLWMFVSSNGSLTAGRRNSEFALFPYYTEDKIHDYAGITGPKTILRIKYKDKNYLWEPFSSNFCELFEIKRNIYKSILGNFLCYEEINLDLNLTFRYSWSNSDEYGFIRKSQLINNSDENLEIDIIDGVQNLLPAELSVRLQNEYSNLVDAYKKGELIGDNKIAAFTLSSIPTDRAEPNESLKANIAWCLGLDNYKVLLSSQQLETFSKGLDVVEEELIRGRRSSFLINTKININSKNEKSWLIMLDVNKSQSEFISLSNHLANNGISGLIQESIAKDSSGLRKKIAQNDGLQKVKDQAQNFRHTSNVLFNIMRGGIFENNYKINKYDFINFIKTANISVFSKYEKKIKSLPNEITSDFIFDISDNDKNLERLIYEYLPLTFSRRHGDPSRPWNKFSIDIKDEEGNPKLDYQGNWRDIFQNWEALAISYPRFIENMIVKFLNASTADGYNPYRVFRDGFDWEVIEPDDEWSYIGYWGDHQIIYLLKLLEVSKKYNPSKLKEFSNKGIFTFANVPYKIKTYKEILENPQDTVKFDFDLNEKIEDLVNQIGSDGKFLTYSSGEVIYAGLMEKLLLPLIVKLSNFIPDVGIWMNTQRPEWNDANNALVGNGASMVTLYYMRRYISYMLDFIESNNIDAYDFHSDLYHFFTEMHKSFSDHKIILKNKFNAKQRKQFLDSVGEIGSKYRTKLYNNGLSEGKAEVAKKDLIDFLNTANQFLESSIDSNKLESGMYHSYNIIDLSNDEIRVERLSQMLEGQVAILSSGYLSAKESLQLLKALKRSDLYRLDQNSYMLYPNKNLPGFLEKNSIPNNRIEEDPVIKDIIQKTTNSILIKDENDNWHFASRFKNANFLKEAVGSNYKNKLEDSEKRALLDLYEQTFNHRSFTGRSGTFFRFEGLGSIYWHMVSKLILAVQETYFKSISENDSKETLEELKTFYFDIKQGLGIQKNPKIYGAFPTDAYSHTPENDGAQQPGMTGQVKEDIISRFCELGVVVENGEINFKTDLLSQEEFLTEDKIFYYYDVAGLEKIIKLSINTLAFTICQVPIIYKKSNISRVSVHSKSEIIIFKKLKLDKEISESIFQINQRVSMIEVEIAFNSLS